MELQDAIAQIEAVLNNNDLLRTDTDGPCNDCGADDGVPCYEDCNIQADTKAWLRILEEYRKSGS